MSPHMEKDPIKQAVTRSIIETCSTSGGGEKQPTMREITQFILAHITAMIALRTCSMTSNMLTVLLQGTQMFLFRYRKYRITSPKVGISLHNAQYNSTSRN